MHLIHSLPVTVTKVDTIKKKNLSHESRIGFRLKDINPNRKYIQGTAHPLATLKSKNNIRIPTK